MHFSTLASTAAVVAAVQSLVAADPGQMGYSLGTKKNDGSCKSSGDYELDLDAINQQSGAKVIRGYSASDCDSAGAMLSAAKSKDFKVVLGIWPDTDDAYQKDLSAIKSQVGQYKDQIYAVTVGSETLYRGNFTGDQLSDKIHEVKGQLDGIKVGTADSWNKFDDGTADAVIQKGVDILLVNGFAFWQGQDISNATNTYFDDMARAFQHIQTVAGGTDKIELWNGETGWPSDGGSDYGAAKAGTDNAKTYYQSAFCSFISLGYNAFYFEAFDEPWKPDSIGDNGKPADEKHWGAMDANRVPKFPLKC